MRQYMPAFINRDPWNLIIGLGGILLFLLVVSAATSWWVLLVPFVLIMLVKIWQQFKRVYSLTSRGFHSEQIRKGQLRYEEIHNSKSRSFVLKLENTESGHYELFIPNESAWLTSVPDWAHDRRNEIAERIAQTWRRNDVHLNH